MNHKDHPDVTGAKHTLRRRIRADRRAVSPDERRRRDDAIAGHLVTLLTGERPTDAFPSVAAYAGLPGEPGGPALPEALRAAGVTVWLPVIAAADRPLTWLPYRGPGTTRPGPYGIPEPTETPGHPSPISTVALAAHVTTLVLPALAVGHDGTRLGQGGGYYDRTVGVLTGRAEPGRLVAVVDHAEFGVDVPRAPHDEAVQVVVTDTGTFPTSASRRESR